MAQSKPAFEPGDHVSWKYGVGKATGFVVEKLTESTKMGSRTYKASPEEPKYKVKSDKSGKPAIRNPETLLKISGSDDGLEEETEDADDKYGSNGVMDMDRIVEVKQNQGDDFLRGSRSLPNRFPEQEERMSLEKQVGDITEKPVDDMDVSKEPASQLGGPGMQESGSEGETAESNDQKSNSPPHKLPHEEVPQPGQFIDLSAV